MNTAELVEKVMAEVRVKASGRTRYEGSPIYHDEVLLAEIERLRELLKTCQPCAHF